MLRVLTYHKIAHLQYGSTLSSRLVSATPESFSQQLTYLTTHYDVVSAEEVLNAVQNGTLLPKRAVLITFDDGYRDFGSTAWPILKQHRVTAALFVPTAYPDHPENVFWWDRLDDAVASTSNTELDTPWGSLPIGAQHERIQVAAKLRTYLQTIPHETAMALVDQICAALGVSHAHRNNVLSWNDLQQLKREGVAIAAHSRTHPILTQIPPAQLQSEITGSLADLKRELGTVLPIFSYPGGFYSHSVITALKEAGVVLAFTTRDGHNDLRSSALLNPLQLRRTNITMRTTPCVFRLRLLRPITYIDLWRHRNVHNNKRAFLVQSA